MKPKGSATSTCIAIPDLGDRERVCDRGYSTKPIMDSLFSPGKNNHSPYQDILPVK